MCLITKPLRCSGMALRTGLLTAFLFVAAGVRSTMAQTFNLGTTNLTEGLQQGLTVLY